MAKLTKVERNNLPLGSFAGPNRTFPIPDKNHAIAAKSRATAAVHAGRMTKSEEEKIDAKANRKLRTTGLLSYQKG